LSQKKHKRLSVKPAAAPNGDINVTPLVDVVLVLLIIFMVVTPLLEKDIPVRTPSSEKVEQVEEVPQDQIIVYVNKDGNLRINSESVNGVEFPDKLKRILDSHKADDKFVPDAATFAWQLTDDEMAHFKLAEGIRKFAADLRKLEEEIAARLKA